MQRNEKNDAAWEFSGQMNQTTLCFIGLVLQPTCNSTVVFGPDNDLLFIVRLN